MGVCHETYLIMRVRDCNNVPWGRETDRGRPHPVPQECWKSEAKVCPRRFKEEGSPQLKGRSAKEPEALGSWPWQRPAIPAQSEEMTWAQSVEPQCNKNVQANQAAGQQSHQIAQPGTPHEAAQRQITIHIHPALRSADEWMIPRANSNPGMQLAWPWNTSQPLPQTRCRKHGCMKTCLLLSLLVSVKRGPLGVCVGVWIVNSEYDCVKSRVLLKWRFCVIFSLLHIN